MERELGGGKEKVLEFIKKKTCFCVLEVQSLYKGAVCGDNNENDGDDENQDGDNGNENNNDSNDADPVRPLSNTH